MNDPIDTTTIQGRLMFNIFASLAEFEKDLIRERTMAGLKSARSRGKMGGRPKGLSEEAKKKARIAEALYKQKELTTQEIANQLNISRTTLYDYLKFRKVVVGKNY
ncbi:recombinase family protein [Francisella noatunensis]